MAGSAGAWEISSLADLILGPAPQEQPPTNPPQPAEERTSAERAEGPPQPPPARDPLATQSTLLLITHPQDLQISLENYANYWSNRGQPVAAFEADQQGIRLACFDCSGSRCWSNSLADLLDERSMHELPHVLAEGPQRIVVAISADPGWSRSEWLHSARQICVVLKPDRARLIWGYEVLKTVAGLGQARHLSVFVIDAESADHATQLSSRLADVGNQFLNLSIRMQGFSVEQNGSASNQVADAAAGVGDGQRFETLQRILLDCLAHTVVESEPGLEPFGHAPRPSFPGHPPAGIPDGEARQSVLPSVTTIPINRPIHNAEHFDQVLGELVSAICDDALDSWPVYTSPADGCRYRWVRRAGGQRTIIVTAIDCPFGALERAIARLYPAHDDDEIVLIARMLTTDHRRAAQALGPAVRLFEAAQLPPPHAPALLLKDVTHAVV